MKLPYHRISALALFALLSFDLPLAQAQQSNSKDLRDIKVGMAVTELPAAGYTNFVCAGERIAGWSAWRDCPADAEGLHAIRFDYDPATSRDGTIVAGHPAILTLFVDEKGIVAGLRIETDPHARLYVRKKAFLLGLQVKSRYGNEGWTCREGQPTGDEQPLGGVFVKESCAKTQQGRSIEVERNLFRRPDQDAKSFVDETRINIFQTKG
jgi:hypothetical protein